MNRFIVVGTGTAVGKTAVSTTLLEGAVSAGQSVLGLKPVETGVSPDLLGDTDATRLGNAARHSPRTFLGFRDALSPHLAAEREGQAIHLDEVLTWIDAQAAPVAPDTWILVETAGGLCTPLSLSTSNLDLVVGMGACSVVLVAPNRLGVLHDVLACVSLLRHSALAPAMIVLTEAVGRDSSSPTNARELVRLTQRPVHEYTPAIAPTRVLEWFAVARNS